MKTTPEEMVKEHQRFKTLCRNVFSSAQGKELLSELRTVYCDGQLYDDNERTTAYLIGQRDVIMELTDNVENGEPTNANE